jgi:hypothetical protein
MPLFIDVKNNIIRNLISPDYKKVKFKKIPTVLSACASIFNPHLKLDSGELNTF